MKITFENFGPIKHSEIDLSKDLILLTGSNNSGKTYVAFGIYGLYDQKGSFSVSKLPKKISVKDLEGTEGENVEINLSNYLNDKLEDIYTYYETNLKNKLSTIFATEATIFENTNINIEFENLKKHILSFGINYERTDEGDRFWELSKKVQSENLTIKRSARINSKEYKYIFDESMGRMFWIHILQNLLLQKTNEYPSTTHIIFPIERLTIYSFSKEILNNRNKIVNEVWDYKVKVPNDENLYNYFSLHSKRFTKPVNDLIEIAGNLSVLQKNKSEFTDLADELEYSVLKGKISVTDNNDVRFVPNAEAASLDIQITGSVVKSLSSLVFYFRHTAVAGDTIIIDEPELNLHPELQIKVARLLAKAVNRGFKVILSTHSDYVIREFNSLIMLNQDSEKAHVLRENYQISKEETLDFTRIGVYAFENQVSTPLDVTETGFSVTAIDKVINQQNAMSEDIYYSLF